MVVVMLSLLEWPKLARLVRGQCLSLRERDFMLATRVLGLSARRRLFGHLLPNTIPILVVMATMAVANAILSESALSYLGLGWFPHALLGQYDGRRQQPDRFPASSVAMDAAGYRHFYHRHCH
jgi:ABC-type dipeptide/oligopeptide/nickel transport system permease subunit